MGRLARYWPCFLSAILVQLAFTGDVLNGLGLSLAGFDLWPLLLFALVPFLMVLRGKDAKEAFRYGQAFGFLFCFFQLHWLEVLLNRMADNPIIAYLPFLLAVYMFSLVYGVGGKMIAFCWRIDKPWLIPGAWLLIELFRAYCPVLAFPWSVLATPTVNCIPIASMSFVGTIFLVSYFLVTCNVILAMIFQGHAVARTLPGILGVALGLALGNFIASIPLQLERDGIQTLIFQPGVNFSQADSNTASDSFHLWLEQAYKAARQTSAELIILPEGVAVSKTDDAPDLGVDLRTSPALIFGGQRGNGLRYQTAFAYDGNWQFADKTRLVPFGEYVPMRILFGGIVSAFSGPTGDLTASDKLSFFQFKKFKVGPMICFESLFPEIAYRHANADVDMMVVLSIDDWFMDSSAPEQLRAATIWRAIETRKPIARCASTGYSMMITPHGDVMGEAPLQQEQLLTAEGVLREGGPFKGSIFVPFGIALVSGAIMLRFRK
ncbi:MAG: apolipoprotein N-acyltransferase [Armatimonadetes bacterium]|nr:apolipoprotein N-acyltransferase [Armatimonadota bacterium]